MPWLRPIIGVSLNSTARLATVARSALSMRAIWSHDSTICTASVVSRMSDDVSPWCIQRAAGPTDAATFSRKAMTSCCVRFSISRICATSNFAFARISAASAFGTSPSSASASVASVSISSQMENFRCSDQISAISGRV